MQNLDDRFFLHCAKCGKRLIERRSNGLFHFVFGRKKDTDGSLSDFCPVDIYVHGSIQMRCLARGCGHMNTFNYFPPTGSENQPAVEPTAPQTTTKKEE